MVKNQKNIGIKGNETIEEFISKVGQANKLEEKLSICLMIITFLEIRNGFNPGVFIHTVASTKKNPINKDPRQVWEKDKFQYLVGSPGYFLGEGKVEIKLFLFFLKKSEKNCYMKLIETCCKMSKKEDRKERLIKIAVVGLFILFFVWFFWMVSTL